MVQSDSEQVRNGYRNVAADLQKRIESGEFTLGSYLPTERELQEEHGVSRTTVRRALASLVETGWAEALPGRGVVAARGFRRVASGPIALIDNDTPVSRMLHARMRDGLVALGFEPILLGEGAGYSMEDALRKAAADRFAAALVWSYEGFPDADLVARVARQLPIVALDHKLEGTECDLVTFDYEGAAYEATTYLVRQGCRRIGVVGMLDMLEITHARFRGYLRAMFSHGLQPEPRDFFFLATSGRNAADPRVIEPRFRSGDRPEGLLVLQDSYLEDVVGASLRAGLAPFQDLNLVVLGDDYDVTIDGRGVSAVAFDWGEFARSAFALLENRLGNLHGPPRTNQVGHRLIVRGPHDPLPFALRTEDASTTSDPALRRPGRQFVSKWHVLRSE